MPDRNTSSSPRPRRSRSRGHQRALRQAAELRDIETRETPPPSRRKRRTPVWKYLRLLALILILAGGVELVVAALTSPKFRVAEVTVSGVEITSEAEVLRVQQNLVGQNWVRAKTDVAQQQLASLPTVKSTQITRALHWPPHLHIHIEERAPFARVGAGQEWWVVDESGVPFRRAGQQDEELYALTGPNLAPLVGMPLRREHWQPAARLVRNLSTQRAVWPLRRVYFDENGFAALRMAGGAHNELLIRLGGDRWEEKLARARVALEYFERTGKRAQSLNLVSYKMPLWTPIGPVQTTSTPLTDSISSGT